MDTGPALPLSPSHISTPKRFPGKKQSSFYLGEYTPNGDVKNSVLNGDVKKPLALTYNGVGATPDRAKTALDLKSIKSARSSKSQNLGIPRINSERSMVVRRPSVKSQSVKTMNEVYNSRARTPGVVSNRPKSIKAPSIRSSKVGAAPKFQRSASSTKIAGSSTARGPSSPRKRFSRSKTMTVISNKDGAGGKYFYLN